jgi:hypothetical protein
MAKESSYRRPGRQTNEASGQLFRPEDKRDPKKKAPTGDRWWWTLAAREADCENCQEQLLPKQKIAYHFKPTKVYCPDCAHKLSVSGLCKPSKKLRRSERALERHSAKALELGKALGQL